HPRAPLVADSRALQRRRPRSESSVDVLASRGPLRAALASSTLTKMERFLSWVEGFALSLGGPGLFLIAFLDSSFLSFPEVCDLLIVWLTIQHPHRMLYYAFMCTAGSVAGCFALYWVGQRGGQAFLEKRFKSGSVDRAMAVFRRFGLLGIIVPSHLPPPMPFKVFVLA